MRKILLSCLMLLALLCSQQAGLSHEIEHQRGPMQSAQQKSPEHPGDRVCSRCLAFAQLAGLLAPSVIAVPLLQLAHLAPTTRLPESAGLARAQPRNRDPPTSNV